MKKVIVNQVVVRKLLAVSAAVLLGTTGLVVQVPANAGIPVACVNCSTNVQQMLEFAKQLEQYSTQIQTYQNQVAQYKTMLTNLASAPERVTGAATKPAADLISSVDEFQRSLHGLRDSAEDVGTRWQRAGKEMVNLGQNPSQYYANLKRLADVRGGKYLEQYNQDVGSMEKLKARSSKIQELAAEIPGIEGNVQGLQLLNTQANFIAQTMDDLSVAIRKQSANQLQDRMESEEAKIKATDRSLKQYEALKAEKSRAKDFKIEMKAPWEK